MTTPENKAKIYKRLSTVIYEWMSVNGLAAKDAAIGLGLKKQTLDSYTSRENQPKFPSLSGFVDLVESIENAEYTALGRHGRKFNYIKLITGEDKTGYEVFLEKENKKLKEVVQQQKGIIDYLQANIDSNE